MKNIISAISLSKLSYSCSLLLLTLSGWCAEGLTSSDWEFVSKDDGVTLYKKEIPGSKVIAFKGEGEIEETPLKVVTVILDYENVKEWVEDMEEVKIISQESALKWMEYSHFGTPFIVKDRDFVTQVEVIPNPKTGEIEMTQTAVEEGRYPANTPKTNYVRGKVISGKFILKPLEGGKKTYLIGELQADPMGSIPKWLVNTIQKSWPKRTLQALRRRVAKVDPEPNAAIKKALHISEPMPL